MVEYHDAFVNGLEWMWGEGFMSPGGAEETAVLLGNTPVAGKQVLDIGCGIAGVDIALVQNHQAAKVIGIDIDAYLLRRGRELVTSKGLQDRIVLKQVEPGALEFESSSLDIVFSKDSLVHVRNKSAIYAEIFRILKPGGYMAVGDWLGNGLEPTTEMLAWLDVFGTNVSLDTLHYCVDLTRQAGFVDIDFADRNTWYAADMRKEIASISGDNFPSLVEAIGEDAATQRLISSTAKLKVVEGGELRPGHIRARKPM
ncbi:MAG: SAM-dependent methyltransferase [Parasphingorhabdus sp.]|jgi:SAM-dependent methyltransferase